MRCAIVHYHELGLKGRNRGFFEQQLIRNIRLALNDVEGIKVERLHQRVRVLFPPHAKLDLIRDRLRCVCGVAYFSMARAVPLTLTNPYLDKLGEAAVEEFRAQPFSTFRITAKRADKRLPVTSMDVERAVGAFVRQTLGKEVSLKNPDLTIHIELLTDQAYLFSEKISGPGGMPVGVSGRVACLLSGGIDSPVAAYRMIKRGCRAVFVHFSGRPLVSRASEEKARDLAKLLTTYQYRSRLYIVPFGEIQREIIFHTPAPFRVVLYRRMMLRIAEHLASRERCWAVVTGESLGQVASQTPDNLCVIEQAATRPLLRPLIGMDKIEITEEAKRLGTYEISIEPDQDCCKLFIPPHPNLRTNREAMERVEAALDLGPLVQKGVEKAEVEEFRFPD
ncbi:MAG: tRNA 4-thiouridine(8) synthase ThiI [Nitrospira sp.]|nr:tRNA 4-thiouridine(8) synthase ThiI [Nitrospira sp.]MCP9464639.1 tRNA 4-thiouridine(8) synthase ThiI [Nitrospira sp.]